MSHQVLFGIGVLFGSREVFGVGFIFDLDVDFTIGRLRLRFLRICGVVDLF
jgi:hypothetical protein